MTHPLYRWTTDYIALGRCAGVISMPGTMNSLLGGGKYRIDEATARINTTRRYSLDRPDNDVQGKKESTRTPQIGSTRTPHTHHKASSRTPPP